jgi:hypothetical protein
MNKKMQDESNAGYPQEELVRQLQAKLNSIQNQVIDLKGFSGPVTGGAYKDRS